MALDQEEYAILYHTRWHAANKAYCTSVNDPWMKSLVEKGLMREVARPSWLREGDAYFMLTSKGMDALATRPETTGKEEGV